MIGSTNKKKDYSDAAKRVAGVLGPAVGESQAKVKQAYQKKQKQKQIQKPKTLKDNSKLKVGNYSVQFDPNTSLKERTAFATRPTRPGTRRRSNLASNNLGRPEGY